MAEVPGGWLERWKIDTAAFLSEIFREIRLSVSERVAGQLWQVGKANWIGRSREVWFARACRSENAIQAFAVLKHRPKAILFAPTERGANQWQETTKNLVIAFESALLFEAGVLKLDLDYLEGRIQDASPRDGAIAKSRPRKRGERAAKIEALKNTVIEHLRSARDHAFATKENTGEPALLPRPTQKVLGKLAGQSESDVSRCLNDPEARELKLY